MMDAIVRVVALCVFAFVVIVALSAAVVIR